MDVRLIKEECDTCVRKEEAGGMGAESGTEQAGRKKEEEEKKQEVGKWGRKDGVLKTPQ